MSVPAPGPPLRAAPSSPFGDERAHVQLRLRRHIAIRLSDRARVSRQAAGGDTRPLRMRDEMLDALRHAVLAVDEGSHRTRVQA